jgi:hypothetical protein
MWVWNVAMINCEMCWEWYAIAMQMRGNHDQFKGEKWITEWVCDKCLAKQKENVNLLCDNCKAYHCVDIKEFKWDKNFTPWCQFMVSKCKECSEDWSFNFNKSE